MLKTDPTRVCGIKVCIAASTGDMLVDESKVLEGVFKEAPTSVATHCEDEATVRAKQLRQGAPWRILANRSAPTHPQRRSELPQLVESRGELATKLNTQLRHSAHQHGP